MIQDSQSNESSSSDCDVIEQFPFILDEDDSQNQNRLSNTTEGSETQRNSANLQETLQSPSDELKESSEILPISKNILKRGVDVFLEEFAEDICPYHSPAQSSSDIDKQEPCSKIDTTSSWKWNPNVVQESDSEEDCSSNNNSDKYSEKVVEKFQWIPILHGTPNQPQKENPNQEILDVLDQLALQHEQNKEHWNAMSIK